MPGGLGLGDDAAGGGRGRSKELHKRHQGLLAIGGRDPLGRAWLLGGLQSPDGINEVVLGQASEPRDEPGRAALAEPVQAQARLQAGDLHHIVGMER